MKASVSGVSIPPYATELRQTIARAVPRLLALDDERTRLRPAAGKWSPREIVGHLIDSASNNHQRFVRAALQDHLEFAGYAQDDWVALQQYHDAPWEELVTLWASYNQHLAHVMTSIPEATRATVHTRHTLDRVAFKAVPSGAPTTLDYFMDDYVRHLQHHLRQIGICDGHASVALGASG
jgi:hypothetical protein